MIKTTITDVSEIILSKIERHDLGDRMEESRAIEIITPKERFLVILEGRDLQFTNGD